MAKRPAKHDHPPALPAALWRSPTALAVLLILLVLFAYLPALRSGFVWDDDALVGNVLLRTVDGLAKIWTTPSAIPKEAHYWPLVYTSFWAEYQLWGLHPFSSHLVNILLHALNTVLLWLLLRRLGIPGAWLAAAIFALHPVHVESVAWVIERKDVLSGMFYLLAFLMYLKFAERRDWRIYILSLLLFVCAMLSKSISVTFPVAMLLVSWWKHDRLHTRDLIPLLPFFLVAAAIAGLDVWLVRQRVTLETGLPLLVRFLIAGKAVWFYVYKLVWPVGLIAIYPKWELDPRVWWHYLFPLAAAAVLFTLWLFRRRLGKGPLAAVLFFVITLAPVLGLVHFGFMMLSYVADRFQYLASIGLIVLFAAAVTRASARIAAQQRWIVSLAASVLLLLLGFLTWQQAETYHSNETLFRHTLAKNPNSWTAHTVLGNVHAARNEFDVAIDHYKRAVELKPDDEKAHNNLAAALIRTEKTEEAISHYRIALQIDPNFAEAHYNLGIALGRQEKIDEAMEHFQAAVQLKPDFINARYSLAIALPRKHEYEPAIEHFSQVLKQKPDFVDAHFNLANVLVASGKIDEAIRHYREVLQLKPDFAEAHYFLGMVLQQKGEIPEAITHYREAVRLRPDWPEAVETLARLLSTQESPASVK